MENNTKSTTDSGFEMHKEQFARLAGMSECGMMIAKMQAEPEIMYANDGFYKMFQYTPEEFRKCFENRVMGPALPEEKQRMKALMARQVSMGGAFIWNSGPNARMIPLYGSHSGPRERQNRGV